MVLVKSDQFVSELSRLFILARNTGAISLVLKRYDGRNRPVPRDESKPLPEPEEFTCLVRATYKSKKISTVINSSEVDKFQQAYCSLLRNNMDGLKKIKKLRSKTKAKHHRTNPTAVLSCKCDFSSSEGIGYNEVNITHAHCRLWNFYGRSAHFLKEINPAGYRSGRGPN